MRPSIIFYRRAAAVSCATASSISWLGPSIMRLPVTRDVDRVVRLTRSRSVVVFRGNHVGLHITAEKQVVRAEVSERKGLGRAVERDPLQRAHSSGYPEMAGYHNYFRVTGLSGGIEHNMQCQSSLRGHC